MLELLVLNLIVCSILGIVYTVAGSSVQIGKMVLLTCSVLCWGLVFLLVDREVEKKE